MKKNILVILYVILTIAGLVLMKFGGNTGTITLENATFSFSMSFISLFGFICYIASFLLSYIIPITAGIVQVLTLLSGYIVFNEEKSINGIIGIALVIVGIVIMNIKEKVKVKQISE